MARYVVEQESVVAAPADRVWARVVTPEGIDDEMRPWMTMTLPRAVAGLTVDAGPLGVPLGRAWLRLGGVVPFDDDRLVVVEVEPGRRFLGRSTMLRARSWEHERTVEPHGEYASLVRDRVVVEPRLLLRPLGPVLRRVVAAFFAHRHRRLVAHVR